MLNVVYVTDKCRSLMVASYTLENVLVAGKY